MTNEEYEAGRNRFETFKSRQQEIKKIKRFLEELKSEKCLLEFRVGIGSSFSFGFYGDEIVWIYPALAEIFRSRILEVEKEMSEL